MTRTDGPYQQRIYAVWESRGPWPTSQDGTALPAMQVAEYTSMKILRKTPIAPEPFKAFTFRRCIVTQQSTGQRIEAIICDGIIVEPKHLRGIPIDDHRK